LEYVTPQNMSNYYRLASISANIIRIILAGKILFVHFFKIGHLAIGCYLIVSTSRQYKPTDVKWDRLFGHLTLFAGGMFNQSVLSSWPCV